MEFYEDANTCEPLPEPEPVTVPEPAPLPAFEPPAPAPPVAEIFPEPVPPVPSAPVVPDVPDVPQPVAEAPLTSGTLLGPSTVGGSTDLGSGWVGGAPDLGASGYIGGTPDLGASTTIGGGTDLGMTWVDSNGTPIPAPDISVVPGPFNAAAANIVDRSNAAITNNWLSGPWTPGYDSDGDGVLNERDPNPRDRFVR